jgi:hypothetical protein
MTVERSGDMGQRSTASLAAAVARHYLGGRRGLIILSAGALVIGLALNWGWLVAAGIAPLLLGVLPCAAMCALGLCASRMIGRSSEQQPPSQDTMPESGPQGATSSEFVASPDDQPTAAKIGSEKGGCC